MKFATKAIVLFALAWGIGLGHAEVYKIVDPQTGEVNYTDTPPPVGNSEKVDLPQVNTQPAAKPSEEESNENEDTKPVAYQAVEILAPADNSTIPPGQMDVVVQVKVIPALQDGHHLQILFDGKALGPPASTTSWVIGNLLRGTHKIQAQIVDSNGETLKESKEVHIHVKRSSRLFKSAS